MSQEFIGQLGGLVAMWEVKPLPEYVFFQEGPGLRKWQWTESGMKVINVTNIVGDGSVDVNNTARYISIEEFKKTYSHFAVQDDDIVVASSGNTYGKIGRIKSYNLPVMMNTSVIRLHSKNRERLDQDYLYAFLRSDYFTNQVENFVTGSAQPNFGPSHLKMMGILTPPLPIQRKIAAILSAYDNLIENNMRRIQILEDMARSLYREWFVHFRFPGHENTPMVESALGPIPEGWRSDIISNAFSTIGGGTPSTKEPDFWEDGNVCWYSPSDLTAANSMFMLGSSKKITATGLQKSNAQMFPVYSVMMTSRATIGVVAINAQTACTNQGFITCLPNSQVSAYQIYFWLLENKDKIISMATGATFKEINKSTFRQFPFLIASEHVTRRFCQAVGPICKQVENLLRKNENLRKTRDLLLPCLISGELDVSGLEIALKESAA